MVEIITIKRLECETVVKIQFHDSEWQQKVHVMSGEVLAKTDISLTLSLRQNDSLLINGKVILWWNQAAGSFIRQ